MRALALGVMVAIGSGSALAADPAWQGALRTRVEVVDLDGFEQRAVAPTARLRVGWHPARGEFSALLEAEAIAGAGGRYDSGANGHTGYPAVIDATGAEINQAALRWNRAPFALTAGRQRVVYGNQRFVGNVGWRQNEQTFDAIDAVFARERWQWRHTWLDRVHRVAGDRARDRRQREHALDAHLSEISMTLAAGQIAAYAFLVDDATQAALGSRTLGARYVTPPGKPFAATLEYARQSRYGHAAPRATHSYHGFEGRWLHAGTTYKAGVERLGGDGVTALQTPLATLHAFNGWADRFTVTPPAGLRDRYLGVARAGKWSWEAVAHDYRSDAGRLRYGREWNGAVSHALNPRTVLLAKLARFDAARGGADATKLWLQCEWTF